LNRESSLAPFSVLVYRVLKVYYNPIEGSSDPTDQYFSISGTVGETVRSIRRMTFGCVVLLILNLLAQTRGGSTQQAADLSSCPSGWRGFEGRCYLLVTSAAIWEDAEFDCNSKGGHLASIHSADENSFIHSLAPDRFLWIGGTDADVEVGFTIDVLYKLNAPLA
jgi:hypothetical protein